MVVGKSRQERTAAGHSHRQEQRMHHGSLLSHYLVSSGRSLQNDTTHSGLVQLSIKILIHMPTGQPDLDDPPL